MNSLTIINKNGQAYIDSREVAELIDKRHADLMESIRGYAEHLTNGKFRSLDFFLESEYEDSKSEKRPCYLLTRKGCDMVANKMTGEKGVLFTAAYITKFEEMCNNPFAGLSKELQAIFINDQKLQIVETRIGKLENTMTIDYSQQETLRELVGKKVIDALGGKTSAAYKLIAGKAFAEIWSYYKNVMRVNSYRNTPAVEFKKGVEALKNWEPDSDMRLMIIGANAIQAKELTKV
jgi:Rha family phage regulatory protein